MLLEILGFSGVSALFAGLIDVLGMAALIFYAVKGVRFCVFCWVKRGPRWRWQESAKR